MTDTERLHIITTPTRYQILKLLLERHYCVKALSKKLGISEPAVSQQMQILKNCGLVTGQRLDYQMHYTVNLELLRNAVESVNELVSAADEKGKNPGNCDCEFSAVCNRRGKAKNHEDRD
jgi:DNA-binding transcriptional ArsR family regulator